MPTRSRHLDRQLLLYDRLRARVMAIWREARRSHPSFAELLQQRQDQILADPGYQRGLTGMRRLMLMEVWRCMSDETWPLVDWRLGDENGPIPEGQGPHHDWSTGRLSTLSETGTLYGGHFWTGTDKCYTGWSKL